MLAFCYYDLMSVSIQTAANFLKFLLSTTRFLDPEIASAIKLACKKYSRVKILTERVGLIVRTYSTLCIVVYVKEILEKGN